MSSRRRLPHPASTAGHEVQCEAQPPRLYGRATTLDDDAGTSTSKRNVLFNSSAHGDPEHLSNPAVIQALDAGGVPMADFLGRLLDLTVSAKDKAGHDMTVVRHVVVAAAPTGMFCH